ncbi:hypothetical protein ACDA63_11895, partial [Uliginosibacterium sp. sgz301328]|uniref:hypothetical protein n=1 Tax=Uliginosibacterium sp. sgz301328 TaxID=3243764 RepID=UPI00359E6ADF
PAIQKWPKHSARLLKPPAKTAEPFKLRTAQDRFRRLDLPPSRLSLRQQQRGEIMDTQSRFVKDFVTEISWN